MARQTKQSKVDATPGKLVLISVLAVVLIAVLYKQFGGSTTAVDRPARRPKPARPSVASRAPAGDADKRRRDAVVTADDTAAQPVNEVVWRPPPLAEVVEYDPFSLPYRFPQPRPQGADESSADSGTRKPGVDPAVQAAQQLNERLEQLRQQGVQVILKEQDEYVALIGDRTIHVGDEIDGLTVTEITPRGVRLERKIQE